ncbi:MAG: hypothetical protein V1809_09660 [Planctomycetota bacterium]
MKYYHGLILAAAFPIILAIFIAGPDSPIILGGLALFLLPAIAAGRAFGQRDTARGWAAAAVAFGLMIFLSGIVRPAGAFVLISAFVSLSLFLFGKRPSPEPAPVDSGTDARSFVIAIFLQILLVAPPYMLLLTEQAGRFLYPPYFNIDFLHHLAIASSTSRSFPPETPFQAGHPLHYYWFFHLFPGALIRWGAPAIPALMASSLAAGFLFLGVAISLVGKVTSRKTGITAGMALVFLTGGYKGVYAIARPLVESLVPGLVRVPSAGEDVPLAISDLSHGIYRDFLYEPHALMALSLILASLSLFKPGGRRTALAVFATGFDAFIGAIGVAWAILSALIPAGPEEQRLRPFLYAVFTAAAGFFTFRITGIFGAPQIGFHPYPAAWKILPIYLLAEYGGLMIMTLAFLRREFPAGRLPRDILLLAATGLAIGLSVGEPANPELFLRKSVKVVGIGFVALAASEIARRIETRRWPALVLPACVLLPTLLTLGMDVAVSSGLRGAHLAIPSDEAAAYRWIAGNTRPEDRLLILPPRGRYVTIPASLSGRNVVLGDDYHTQVFRPDDTGALTLREEIWEAYRSEDTRRISSIARRNRAAYVLAGPYEERMAPGIRGRLRKCRETEEVFRNSIVSIFRIR